ncbi:Wzz/FepE/Etk N-terminal domain-containing protein, partial [Pseudomonas aeruginosa]
MPSSQLPGASPSEIDIVQLFQQLWASKWLIALIAALATAAALAYALLGVVRRNPRNFRQPSSSPATSASRSMNLPSV